ncbi:MAG: hypothetical protein U0350_37905 [Caldilineaceae bacterium]
MDNQGNLSTTSTGKAWRSFAILALPFTLLFAMAAVLFWGAQSASAQTVPAIQITKTTNKPVVVQGANISFTLAVNNVSPVDNPPLSNVTPVDGQCQALTFLGGDANNNGTLDKPETWTWRCDISNVQQSIDNIATVSADASSGKITATSGKVHVEVLNKGVHVTKKANGSGPFVQGDSVSFTIVVSNTGQATIPAGGITLNDPLCTPTPTTNAAALNGSPSGLTGQAATFACTVNNVQDDFINNVTATAKDANGATFTHTASVKVPVFAPGLIISKSPSPLIATKGQTVTWTIKVANTGEISFTNVSVTDVGCSPLKPIINGGTLAPGTITTTTCSVVYSTIPASGIITNTASVQGTTFYGAKTLNKSVTSQVKVLSPALTVTKTNQNGDSIFQVLKGQTASFIISAKNTGDSDLSNVTISDLLCTSAPTLTGGDTNGDSKINVGETWTWSCNVANVTSDFSNVAVVTTKDVNGVTRSGSAAAFVDVINPGINIVKGPAAGLTVSYGLTATFQITVTNKDSANNSPLSNVAVTDAQCTKLTGPTGDTGNDKILADGEKWVYTCSVANVQKDFDNVATVNATDVTGAARTAGSNTVHVNVLRPDLVLSKQPKLQMVREGQPISWTLYVTNTGGLALTVPNTTTKSFLIDPLCDTLTPASVASKTLAAGASWKFVCTANPAVTFVQNVVHNEATAVFALRNSPVVDTDSADAQVLRNSLNLFKTPNPSVALKGTDVKFTFSVRNRSSLQTLSNVVVSDAQCPGGKATYVSGDANSDGKLQSTEVWSFECTVANVQADFGNTATATAKDDNGNTVSDTDSATVKVINAGLNVEKTTGTPIVNQGQNVNFTISVKNTGSRTLNSVSVTDAMCQGGAPTRTGGDVNGDNKLNQGETWQYSCTVPGSSVQNNFVNTASVSSKDDQTGLPVTGAASASVTVIVPGLSLQKTPANQDVLAGNSANFVLLVANTGNTDLANVQVTDAQCSVAPSRTGGDTNNDGKLSVGETWSYGCVVNNVQTNFTNSAVVTAQPVNGGNALVATGTANVHVLTTGIDLQKTPKTQTVNAGGSANFTLVVTNRGNAPLSNVVLTDATCDGGSATYVSGDTNNNQQLDANEAWTYSCVVNNVQANFINSASVTAKGPNNAPVSAQDTASVSVLRTGISLTKQPKTQTVNQGGSANFTLLVQNTGNTSLSNVQVTDAKCSNGPALIGGDVNSNGQLDTSETWVYTCATSNVQTDFVNTASATASGIATPATDTANVTVNIAPTPRIAISKTPKTQTVAQGGTANFTLAVTNAGNASLSNVQVSDPLCSAAPVFQGGDTNSNAQLDTTETWVYTCATNNVQANFTNIASVTATGANQNVNASDSASVTVQSGGGCATGGVDVVIDPHTATAVKGSTVNFNLTLKSVACDGALSNIVLKVSKCNVKPGAPAGDANSNGKLDPTETWTYSCSATNVKSNFTNTASVTAIRPDGKKVKDSDISTVKVTKSAVKGASVDSADDSDNTDTWDLSDDADAGDLNINIYLPAIAK